MGAKAGSLCRETLKMAAPTGAGDGQSLSPPTFIPDPSLQNRESKYLLVYSTAHHGGLRKINALSGNMCPVFPFLL